MPYKPTTEQQNIIEKTRNLQKNKILLVSAKSGTGKSFTGKMIVEAVKPSSVLGFAFNKTIVEENKHLYPDYVEWRTLHALALSKVRPKLPIEDFTYTCIKEPLSYAEKRIIINMMDDYYRSAAIDMYDFMESYLATRDIYNDKLVHITAKYIDGMINDTINPSFNHLLKYLHVLMVEGEININYDMVLLDECIPAGYLVDTDRGYIDIKNIVTLLQNGEEILVNSYNPRTKEFAYKKATNPLVSKNRQTFRLITAEGSIIDTTPNHKILTNKGYITMFELYIRKLAINIMIKESHKYDYDPALHTNIIKSIYIINNEGYKSIIDKIIPWGNSTTVYDFEVEDNHNFIVYKLDSISTTLPFRAIVPSKNGIIVHNCQDSTAVALEIFKLINANMKVGLGDEHQSLYAFMNLVNGFEVLTEADTAELTQSFRCSTEIAERVEKFGKQYLSHDFHFKGNPNPEADGRMIYITATNAQIVERLAELQRQGIHNYTLTRPITEIFAAPLALMTASKGKSVLHKKYKFLENEYKIFSRSSYNKFFTFLNEEVDDDEIKNAIKLLMNFQKKHINVFDVMAQAKKARKDRNLIIGTYFSLKGLGVETVYIEDDINSRVLEIIAKGGPENHDDKVIMMGGYVAATRAKVSLLNAKYL